MDGIKGSRPLGIKLIAALSLLESAALILAAIVGYLSPDLRPRANVSISQRAPLLQAFDAVDLGVRLAPLFALVNFIEGTGIWFMKRWARTFILWDLVNRLGGGVCAAAMLWAIDRQMLSSIVSAPHFLPGLVVNVVILGYLFDPDAKRAFGIRDDEPENWWAGGPL